MKLKTKIIILSAVFVFAAGLVLYPFFADIHNNKIAESLIVEYEENISDIDDSYLAAAFEAALEYNSALSSGGVSSLYEGMTVQEIYESLLNLSGDGVMGYIVIPSIDVNLPIYHYTDEEVLKKGVGHLESTALPVGGTSTRCVLSGHRGLPGSKLFTDLDRLEIGDVFYLKVLGRTLAYEVASIEVVLPDEVDSLNTSAGEDLCTLITCTPYGINTHRLLVTGTRIEYVQTEEVQTVLSADPVSSDYILLYAAAAEAAVFLIILIVLVKRNNRGKNLPRT